MGVAALVPPTVHQPDRTVVGHAVVHRYPRARVGVEGEVRRCALAVAVHASGRLVGVRGLVAAAAAAAATPGHFPSKTAPGGEREAGPPDRDHIGRGRGPVHYSSFVTGGREIADTGLGEVRVTGRLAGELRRPPAVGDVLRVVGRVLLGREQVRGVVAGGLDEQDVGRGGKRMGPLDVEAYLKVPVRVC